MVQLIVTPCTNVTAPTELSYFTSAFSLLLLFLTVCGNSLVVLAVYKDPQQRLRRPYMYLLLNLSVTDLIVGCITLPIAVATHYMEAVGTKKNGHVIVSRMTYFVACTASILNLTAFCMDRYVAVKWPFRYRHMFTGQVSLFIALGIWVTAIGIGALYFVFGFINYLFVFAHVSVILAIFVCIVTYFLLRKLNKVSKARTRLTSQQGGIASRNSRLSDQRITKLFLTILILFLACYLPAITIMYILKFCPRCDCYFRHVLRDLNFLFIAANSAVNPYVCAIRLKSFRNALKSIFTIKLEEEDEMELSPRDRTFSRRLASSFRRTLSGRRRPSGVTSPTNRQTLNPKQGECKIKKQSLAVEEPLLVRSLSLKSLKSVRSVMS